MLALGTLLCDQDDMSAIHINKYERPIYQYAYYVRFCLVRASIPRVYGPVFTPSFWPNGRSRITPGQENQNIHSIPFPLDPKSDATDVALVDSVTGDSFEVADDMTLTADFEVIAPWVGKTA